MSDLERVQQRHYDGMCGGDCVECVKQQEREAQRRNYEEAQREDAQNTASAAHPADSEGKE